MAEMVANYLLQEGGPLHGISDEELGERTGFAPRVARQRVVGCPWWDDVPSMVQAAKLELGISLRGANGREVTFYPESNFHQKAPESLEAKAKPPETKLKIGSRSNSGW